MTVETALALPLFFLAIVTMISFMDIFRIQTEHLTKLCQKAKETGMYASVLEESGVKELTLPDIYEYCPINGVIPLGKIWICNTVKIHAWTGEDHGVFRYAEDEEPEAMVYVTENGQVYHKSLSCSHLDLSVTQVVGSSISSRRNVYGEKYHACSACSRGQKASGTVYITEKGNRYHNSASCSGLKRSVKLVKESGAGKLAACSRCG